MNELFWNRITSGEYKSQGYDRFMERVPHRYVIRRGTGEHFGWLLYIDNDEIYSGDSTLKAVKEVADRHHLKAVGRKPHQPPKLVSVVKQGDRITSPRGEMATVIRVTGANSAIIRFDADVEYAVKHGLPRSKSDMEFDLTDWVTV